MLKRNVTKIFICPFLMHEPQMLDTNFKITNDSKHEWPIPILMHSKNIRKHFDKKYESYKISLKKNMFKGTFCTCIFLSFLIVSNKVEKCLTLLVYLSAFSFFVTLLRMLKNWCTMLRFGKACFLLKIVCIIIMIHQQGFTKEFENISVHGQHFFLVILTFM